MGKVPQEVINLGRMRTTLPGVWRFFPERPLKDAYERAAKPSPGAQMLLSEIRGWRARNTDLSPKSFERNVVAVLVDVGGRREVHIEPNIPLGLHSEPLLDQALRRHYGDYAAPSSKIRVLDVVSERQFCTDLHCRELARKNWKGANLWFLLPEKGYYGERRDWIEHFWVDGVPTPGKGKGGRGGGAPPSAAQSSPVSRTGVESRGTAPDNTGTLPQTRAVPETRVVPETHPVPEVRASGPVRLDTEPREAPRLTGHTGPIEVGPVSPYPIGEIDPGGVLGGVQSKVAGLEGAAQLLYDRQLANLYRDAMSEAEKAFDRPWIQNAIFNARADGEWVLMEINLIETDAPDSQGNRRVEFWSVNARGSLPPGATNARESAQVLGSVYHYDMDALRKDMLDRVREIGHPVSPDSESASSQTEADDRRIPSGWHGKRIDYQLLPPSDVGYRRLPVQLAPWQRRMTGDRATIGRCTRDD